MRYRHGYCFYLSIMKNWLTYSLIIALAILTFNSANAADKNVLKQLASQGKELRTVPNSAFQIGEKLKYRIHYGLINAGYAELNIESTDIQMHGNKLFHVVAKGRSVYAFDPFFKVRDTYETYIDQDAMLPWLFFRDCSEGGYKIKQNVVFNHFNNIFTSEFIFYKYFSIWSKSYFCSFSKG